MSNNIRYDLSDWLIHFFRDVDIESDSGMVMPENIGWNNIFEYDSTPLGAFFLLRCAIRQQMIWATWAYRNKARTIYGEYPAVCFSDMPIAAFFEAAEKRKARGEHISTFAIIINKAQLAQCGALPVIYGLSQNYTTASTSTGARVINPQFLPLAEQYRFVAYKPSYHLPIDWTHEREWRWACHDKVDEYNRQMSELGLIDSFENMPALNLLRPDLNGMGIVVSNASEAKLVSYDLLSLIDRGLIAPEKYKFILSLSHILSLSNLRNPSNLNQEIAQSLIDPLAGLDVDENIVEKNYQILKYTANNINSNTTIQCGERGSAWLWLYDGAHPFARSMKIRQRLYVNDDGRYLVKIDEFSKSRGLRQQEKMIEQLATSLQTQLGIQCGYFSVLGHEDPNGVPFYCNPSTGNSFIYNKN